VLVVVEPDGDPGDGADGDAAPDVTAEGAA
jgi:hypothetical protein